MHNIRTILHHNYQPTSATQASIILSDLPKSEYKWLADLAFHAPIRMPKLTCLILSEDEYCPWTYPYSRYIIETCQLPSKVAAAFKDMGVEYSVQIRWDREGIMASKDMSWAAHLSSMKESRFPMHPGWVKASDDTGLKRTVYEEEG